MIRPAGLVLLLLAVSRLARADGSVTDRNYTIDAYRGATVADYRVVGMGGASLARLRSPSTTTTAGRGRIKPSGRPAH